MLGDLSETQKSGLDCRNLEFTKSVSSIGKGPWRRSALKQLLTFLIISHNMACNCSTRTRCARAILWPGSSPPSVPKTANPSCSASSRLLCRKLTWKRSYEVPLLRQKLLRANPIATLWASRNSSTRLPLLGVSPSSSLRTQANTESFTRKTRNTLQSSLPLFERKSTRLVKLDGSCRPSFQSAPKASEFSTQINS